jgi:hypothetical protein
VEPARPLPHYFAPLARAIAGWRPVAVRTGPSTAAALAAAGKSAATVGGVIHMRRFPDRSAGSAQVVAHELVHVARPSARARFFADDRHSPEETLAEHTGQLARALVAPHVATPPARRSHDRLAWGTQGMAVGALGGLLARSNDVAKPPPPPVVRRRSDPSARPSLVERTADLFRQPVAPRVPAIANPEFPAPGDPPIVRRSSWGTPPQTLDSPASEATEATAPGGMNTATFEALVEALEQRVIDELERRGLRHHPGVF